MKFFHYIFYGIILLCFFFSFPNQVKASISSCTANVDLSSVAANSTNDFNFDVTNNDSSNRVYWIKITRPSDNFTISSASSGWPDSTSSDSVTFTGSYLGPSVSNSFTLTASAGSSNQSSNNWSVQVSDDSGGSSPTSCSGTLGTEITGGSSSTSTTTTTTTTTTNTVNKIITATPLPSPTPDRVPPAINVKTDFKEKYAKAPVIEGSASDVSGVASLQYSLDDGRNWLPVDQITGVYGRSSTFSIDLPELYDGTYQIKIRAADGLGNTGSSKSYPLTIDRLPPRIGASLFTIGPQILSLKNDNRLTLLSGLKTKIALSAVGGPNEIKLYVTPFGSPASLTNPVLMTSHPESGIWTAELSVLNPGSYEISALSKDGAENTVERKVADLNVISQGVVTSDNSSLKNAKITVYNLDTLSNRFNPFDGDSYSLTNPLYTDENGSYGIFLPSGSYYLTAEKPGYRKIRTDIFTLDLPTTISSDLSLHKLPSISLAGINISMPQFFPDIVGLKLPSTVSQSLPRNQNMIGKQFPEFDLKFNDTEINQFSFTSSPSLLTFINTWSPQAFDQLNVLESLEGNKLYKTYVFVPQEGVNEVFMFKSRGKYQVPIVADPDGVLFEKLDLDTLPAHVFLDRFGVIKNIEYGFLQKDEIEKKIFDY